jgi:hypothetical protein
MVDNLYGRSYDGYSALLERREALNDMSTRELLEELEDRLERRQKPSRRYTCSGCGRSYGTAAARDACLNSVRISCYAFLRPEAHWKCHGCTRNIFSTS